MPIENTARLDPIQAVLERAGFDVEALEQQRLRVSFEASIVSLELYYQEDALLLAEPENSSLAAELTEPGGSLTLCFSFERECELPQERMLELYRLLNVWNGMLPLGAFGLNESEPSGIIYHYALLHDQSFNPMLVAEMLDQIGFYLTRLMPLLTSWILEGSELDEVLSMADEALTYDSLSQMQRNSIGD